MQIATITCMTTTLKFMLFLATVLTYKLVILTIFAVYDCMISYDITYTSISAIYKKCSHLQEKKQWKQE